MERAMKRKLEQIALFELKPSPVNSRTHSDSQVEKIAASIREFGFTVPILLDGGGEVIAGHGRLLAAARLEMDKVPVIRLPDLTPDQVRAYRIADNRLTDLGGWDDAMLAEELSSLKDADFDLTLTGFDLNELDHLLDPEPDPPIPDIPEGDPITKSGDIWTLGDHRLMCGDCTARLKTWRGCSTGPSLRSW